MKKLFVLSSILSLFFMGCGGTQTCKDLATLLKCGIDADTSDAVKKCSKLPEEQQAKLLTCYKNEEEGHCTALKAVKVEEILRIALKCDQESRK